MRRFLVYAAGLLVLFVVQCSAFRIFLPLTDITPNLLLLFVISFGLMRGEKTGLFLGFFAGILIDIIYADQLGFYALLFMFLGYLLGLFHQTLTPGSFLPAVALIGAGDLCYGLAVYVFQFLLRSRFHFRFYLLHVILPEAVLTLLIALILYPLLFLLNDSMEAAEQRRARKFV